MSTKEGWSPYSPPSGLVITLCGSARFERHFRTWDKWLTLAGHTVFSLAVLPSMHGRKDWYSEAAKEALDAAHRRKINLSDAIVVLNAFAYMGESTLAEVRYATEHGKAVYFLESWGEGNGVTRLHTDACIRLMESYGLAGAWARPGGQDRAASPIRTCDYPSPLELLGPAGSFRSSAVQAIWKSEGMPPWGAGGSDV